jgi:beta-lactamase class A
LSGAGWYAHSYYVHHDKKTDVHLVFSKNFQLTSPLLDVKFPEGMGVNYEPLTFKHKVNEYVNQVVKSGLATEVSVYYRDLLDGPWFGINESKEFDPGSMMKVTIMIAWLKRAEKDPKVLKQELIYNYPEDKRLLQTFVPARSIDPGRSYTVDELLEYMIEYSDNNAAVLLYQPLGAGDFIDLIQGMDVHNKRIGDKNLISAVDYSGFFRILHNASYLNREMSEKALKLLSKQDFSQGIVAGVPKGTIVASKFGESLGGVTGQELQLHEFGIVYHPHHRYLLGVMTQGSDLNRLAQVIQGVSKIVYDQVDAGTFSPDDKSQ